uniref:Peptidase S1 domain-containing protein n=1 Tax=Glossina brevipalpis TaxID=37001 RepID=A0A1A9WCH5_9MUSC
MDRTGKGSLYAVTFRDHELNEDENEEETFLISGGYRLKTHDKAKYAVSVRKRFVKTIFGDTHLCGGSIISSKVILTSAHCMFISDAERQYNANELSVIIGTPNRLNRTLVSERLLVSHIKIHEKFSNDAVYWDIALMILYKNIKLNGWSAAIVPLSVVPAKIGTICTALGWGRLYENGPITNQVTYIDVPLLDYNTCTRLMPNFGEGQFCAADGEDLQKDACEGDVGGPLICDGRLQYTIITIS